MAVQPLIPSSSPDTLRALVIEHIGDLARAGRAVWHGHNDGAIEVWFMTGEIFLLEKHAVTRLA
ncbi:hypothetical protein ACFO8O_13555 [Hephaestia sp. GCM10023244]|uniref:hypothetical protein n=1 Tax=unclassified Hephaestia TaxID=2631281 RepID=UPI002076F895|nr:hypothetical protein [Hephaestia sp. MAHUQ-44]MCM8731986.1 hypothetical protein [Hephaestia sp. MAHUQ-44]